MFQGPAKVGCLLGLLVTSPALAATVAIGQIEEIVPADIAEYCQFGRHVTLDELTLVVGAPQDAEAGQSAGSAYVFRLDAGQHWQQVAKLLAADAQPFDEFGRDVSLSGDQLLIGAPHCLYLESGVRGSGGNEQGSGYVFSRSANDTDTWVQVARITADDTELGDEFGHSVAIDGDTVVIGARFDDDAGPMSGSAYIFERQNGDTWVLLQKLTGGAASGWFATSLDLAGSVIAVGAPGPVFNPTTAGRVHVFTASPIGWLETELLTGSSAVAGDRFGSAVAATDLTIAVAATGSQQEAVFVFDREPGSYDWVETTRIPAPCGTSGTGFGTSLALHKDILVVGAPYAAEDIPDAGAAYLFARNTGGPGRWGMVARVIAEQPNTMDQLGGGTAVSYDAVVVGAPGRDAGAPDTGAVYTAVMHLADTDNDDIPDLADNCLNAPNGAAGGSPQNDTDNDGFGNACDADLDNDCIVNFNDLQLMADRFFTADVHADFNGDGQVDFADLAVMSAQFFLGPGPSALAVCEPFSAPRQRRNPGGLKLVSGSDCRSGP